MKHVLPWNMMKKGCWNEFMSERINSSGKDCSQFPGRSSRFRKSQTSLVYILQWEFSTDSHKLKHRLKNDNSLRSTGPQKLYTWQETLNQEWDKEKDEEKKVFLRKMLDFTAFCLFLKVFQRNKSLTTLKYKIIINYRNREDWEFILVSLKEETIFPETC